MTESKSLENYKALVDDAFKDASSYVSLKREKEILSEAHIHLTRKDFQKLEKYVSERLEK